MYILINCSKIFFLTNGAARAESEVKIEVGWRRWCEVGVEVELRPLCAPGDGIEWRRWCGQGGDGTALLARGAVLRGVNRIGEVSFGSGAAELACCSVVDTRGLFGSVKGAEPDARCLARVADLSFVPSPGSLSHAPITDLLGFRVWVNGSVCINRILRAS